MWLPWESGVKFYPEKGGSLHLGRCLVSKLYGDFSFGGGKGENCGLGLHFTDLKTPVICPLLYLVHSFLDSVGRRCGVFRCAPNGEIICMYGEGEPLNLLLKKKKKISFQPGGLLTCTYWGLVSPWFSLFWAFRHFIHVITVTVDGWIACCLPGVRRQGIRLSLLRLLLWGLQRFLQANGAEKPRLLLQRHREMRH